MKASLTLALCAAALPAQAWGPSGHQTVATLAEQLIAGQPAAAKVADLLNGLNLAQAAVWADCAKSVETKTYTYKPNPRFEECRALESAAGVAEMEDFVRRNDRNCPRRPRDESCHKQYHYTDTAIQRSRYHLGDHGTRSDDIVGAVQAAILVLQGQPAPQPFSIKSPREALLLLVHYVGDIHQPLHVGAVYLDAKGRRLDPTKATVDDSNDTNGGNDLILASEAASPTLVADDPTDEAQGFVPGPIKFHSVWDSVSSSMQPEDVKPKWLAQARAVRASQGPILGWPEQWATGSLRQANKAFATLKFSVRDGSRWTTQLPAGYSSRATAIKRQQLTLAGARLAQVLMAVFP